MQTSRDCGAGWLGPSRGPEARAAAKSKYLLSCLCLWQEPKEAKVWKLQLDGSSDWAQPPLKIPSAMAIIPIKIIIIIMIIIILIIRVIILMSGFYGSTCASGPRNLDHAARGNEAVTSICSMRCTKQEGSVVLSSVFLHLVPQAGETWKYLPAGHARILQMVVGPRHNQFGSR